MHDDIADLERSLAMIDALRRLSDMHREVLLDVSTAAVRPWRRRDGWASRRARSNRARTTP